MQLFVNVDVFFKLWPMPCGIKAFVREDQGIYYVFINSNLCAEAQTKAITHEYNHLINDDLHSDDPVDVIERRNK